MQGSNSWRTEMCAFCAPKNREDWRHINQSGLPILLDCLTKILEQRKEYLLCLLDDF